MGEGSIAGSFLGSLVGTLGAEWTKIAIDLVRDRVGSQSDEALRRGLDNAREMLVDLGVRVQHLEANRLLPGPGATVQDLHEAFADPDVVATLRDAIAGAARSSDRRKQHVLASTVVARLTAKPESSAAVAASLAARAVGQLSSTQLDLLGIAAAVSYVGPMLRGARSIDAGPEPITSLSEDRAERQRAQKVAQEQYQRKVEESSAKVRAYREWVLSAIRAHSPFPTVHPGDYTHLVSTGCAVLEQAEQRQLQLVLTPEAIEDDTLAGSYRQWLGRLFSEPEGRALAAYWDAGLRQVVLTPSGVLIGLEVHQWRTGESAAIDWTRGMPSAHIHDRVWGSRGLSGEFMAALEAATRERAMRGVHPWRELYYPIR